MQVIRDVMLTAADGVRLCTDIFLPETDAQRYPTILVRSPYIKEMMETVDIGENTPASEHGFNIDVFIRQGYAIVVQDCRGTGKSDGIFKPWLGDAQDGYDLVEWTYRQPWCNGKIGFMGPSNIGATQLLAASKQPPHLTCIAPMGTSAYLPFFKDGIFQLAGALIWYLDMAESTALRTNITEEQRKKIQKEIRRYREELQQQYQTLPLRKMELANDDLFNMDRFLLEFMDHLHDSGHWTQYDCPANAANISVPTLLITNWYDHLSKNMFNLYDFIMHHGAPEAQENLYLYIGPWRKYAGVEGTADGRWGAGESVSEILLEWFDLWLKGKETRFSFMPKVYLHTMGEVSWRYEDTWPPANMQPTRLYLSGDHANSAAGDGKLQLTPSWDGCSRFWYDPANPVPTRAGIMVNPKDALRQSQEDVEARQDVLVYTSAPLREKLELVGPVRVTVWASSSACDTDFTAKLVDVLPDGRTYCIVEGIIRARYRMKDQEELMIPGSIYPFTIDLGATGIVLQVGHQLRLEVSSSNFPKFDRNMNTGNRVGMDETGIPALQTVYHDVQHPSHVLLPVIAGNFCDFE